MSQATERKKPARNGAAAQIRKPAEREAHETALKQNPHLARGLNVLKGEITYPAVAEAMDLPWSDPFGVWAHG